MGTTWGWLPALAGSLGVLVGCDVTRVFAEGGGGEGGAPCPGCVTTAGSGPGGSGGDGGSGGAGGSGAFGGSGGSGGAPPSCGAGQVCVPEPPVGWQGPLVLYEGPNGVPAPDCAANHPTQIGDFFGGLDGGTATCGCSCGAATGIVCSASSSACYNSSCLAVCNSALGHTTQSLSPTAGCSQTAASGSAIHVGNPAPTNMGSCQPQTNNSIPTPTFADAARVCGGAATTTVGCGANELCTPEGGADFARMCIAQSGDLTCLDPFYSVKHLLAAGFTDGRSCSTCGCNPAVSTCGGAIDFSSNSCTVLVDAINAGACAASPGAGLFINYNPSPSGTCGVTGGMLSGSVTEQGPLTLCCDG